MSTHQVPVILVKLEAHPNADALSVVRYRNFTVVVRTEEWKDGDLGAYIEPDMVLPARPEYEWLGKNKRLRAKKLRGVWSMGLLVKAPEGARVGDDVMAQLGVVRYEPPFMGESVAMGAIPHKAPPGLDVRYDVENWYRYGDVLQDDEPVVVTEKIHGTNARFTARVHEDGTVEFFVGSRGRWLDEGANAYWQAVQQYPGIRKFCMENPDLTLYGEIYGWVQDLRYDHAPGKISFAAFDILFGDGRWSNWSLMRCLCEEYDIPTVPVVTITSYHEKLSELADGKSMIASHMREGIVIRPITERWDREVGRVQLKVVSNKYLERA